MMVNDYEFAVFCEKTGKEGDAIFDLSGLNADESYQLEINHNTDSAVVGSGHWFDNVRWSNVSFQVCDGQSDLCVPCTPPAAPTGLAASVSTANQVDLRVARRRRVDRDDDDRRHARDGFTT